MKRKVRIIDNTGKVLEAEYNTRNYAHLEACLKYRATTVRPKKGKGSYKRNKYVNILKEI